MNTAKKISFILLLIAIAVISGCARNLPKNQPKLEDKIPVEIATTTNIIKNATTTEPVASNTVENINVVATSTKNRLTYKNEEYGFEVKYPEGWELKQSSFNNKQRINFVSIPPRDTEIVEEIQYTKNIEDLKYENLKQQKINQYKDVTAKVTELKIDGEPSFKIDTTEWMISRTFFIHGDLVFEITTMGDIIYKSILNTFKFIR